MKYCCVPGCSGYGGHKFPKADSLKLKWRVAIKRQDEKTKSLWMPNENSVVCRLHFQDTNYKETLLGIVPIKYHNDLIKKGFFY